MPKMKSEARQKKASPSLAEQARGLVTTVFGGAVFGEKNKNEDDIHESDPDFRRMTEDLEKSIREARRSSGRIHRNEILRDLERRVHNDDFDNAVERYSAFCKLEEIYRIQGRIAEADKVKEECDVLWSELESEYPRY